MPANYTLHQEVTLLAQLNVALYDAFVVSKPPEPQTTCIVELHSANIPWSEGLNASTVEIGVH